MADARNCVVGGTLVQFNNPEMLYGDVWWNTTKMLFR